MGIKFIQDTTQMRVDDLLEYRCQNFGFVTQWRIVSIQLGAMNTESLIELKPVTNIPKEAETMERGKRVLQETVLVPEELTRHLTIVRHIVGEHQ